MFVVLPVALLVGVEVDAGVVVLDGVAVLVHGGGLLFDFPNVIHSLQTLSIKFISDLVRGGGLVGSRLVGGGPVGGGPVGVGGGGDGHGHEGGEGEEGLGEGRGLG